MIEKIYDKKLFTVFSSIGTVSLFSLAIPILFETVMNNLQGTVNTAVLSGYSETAVAAVGAVNTVINVILLFGSVVSTGASVIISNYIGSEDIEKAREVTFVSICVSLFFALILSPVLLIFREGIMSFLNLEGLLKNDAITYFAIRISFVAINFTMSACLSVLKCFGFPKYTFLMGLFVNILNLVFNIFVIKCPEISPVTGVMGVACSSVLSNVIGLIVVVGLLKKVNIKVKKPQTFNKFLTYAAKVLKIGFPSGISGASFSISMMVTTSFVALIGEYALSAKVYFTNILSYVYLFSMSVGSANSLLVGRRYGAGNFELADKMNRQLVKITIVVNLLISLVIIAFRRQLVGIFTHSEQIITLALGVFVVDIITEQARAVSQVYEYALRAVGDVLAPMIVLIISCWTFSIGLAYFLSVKCGMGLIGLWIGLAIDESVRAIFTFYRWKKGNWKYKTNN